MSVRPILIIILMFVLLFVPITVFAQTSEPANESSLSPTNNDVTDVTYGEYDSPGNTWIELTHSAAVNPPWVLDWSINHHETYTPLMFLDHKQEETDVIKKFYQKYDITIIDVIHSSKNRQNCEAISCLFGTYHLLLPTNDYEKVQNLDFGFVRFASSGIVESIVGGDGSEVARWQAEKIFLSTDGKLELNLKLFYESIDPTSASYYSIEDSGEHVIDVGNLNFVDSMVILRAPNAMIPLDANSISSKEAYVTYSGQIPMSKQSSLEGQRIEFGLNWVRIFEDKDGDRYYQWMRSNSQDLFRMNEIGKVNGTFFVHSPLPESVHKANDSSLYGFDYVEWIKENIYNEFKNEILIEDIRSRLYQSDYQTYEISFKDRKYEIPYYISGNNNIESMNLEYSNSALESVSITINSLDDGDLLIKIPHEFAILHGTNHSYLPLIDGQEPDFEQNDPGRSCVATYFSIPFKKGNLVIEIVPAYTFSSGCIPTSKLIAQLGSGSTNEEIVCADGFQKIFKKSNNFPACVKPETKTKLIERGWTEK